VEQVDGMARHFLGSLRARLLLLVVLAVVPVLALSIVGGLEHRRQSAEQGRAQALRLARLAASEHGRLVEQTRQLLTSLALVPAIREAAPAACPAILRRTLDGSHDYNNLSVSALDGTLMCSGRPIDGSVNSADRQFFQRVVSTGQFAVGEYTVGRVTGRPGLLIGAPVHDANGVLSGVLLASIDLTWLTRFAAGAELPEGARLAVVLPDGSILARYPDPERATVRLTRDETLTGQQGSWTEGTSEITGSDGSRRLTAFVPLDRGSDQAQSTWITVSIPTDVALANADRLLAWSIGALLAVALLTSAIVWLGGDLLVLRGIGRLVAATRRLAHGDLKARSGLHHDGGELGALAQTFDEMADNLERREAERQAAAEALRESEARYQRESLRLLALHEASTMIAQSATPDHLLQEILRNAVTLAGADSGSAYRWDAEAGLLRCIRNWNVPAVDTTPNLRSGWDWPASRSCGSSRWW
jgi:HAMP domain-containing protein